MIRYSAVLLLLLAACAPAPSAVRSDLRAVFARSLFTLDVTADLDGDGLSDAMEAELALVFRPFLVFDSDEAARESDEPIVLFQVRKSNIAGLSSDGTRITLVQIKWVFLFREDGGYGPGSWCDDAHEGDNDDALFELESRDDGVTWTLVRAGLSSNGPDTFAGPVWPDEAIEVHDLTHPTIYMSAHKHHEYFDTENNHDDSRYSDVSFWDDCNDDVNGEGARFLVDLYSIAKKQGWESGAADNVNNVGEPAAHPSPRFVNDLSIVFAGHSAWGAGAFYEVGPIRDKWLK